MSTYQLIDQLFSSAKKHRQMEADVIILIIPGW